MRGAEHVDGLRCRGYVTDQSAEDGMAVYRVAARVLIGRGHLQGGGNQLGGQVRRVVESEGHFGGASWGFRVGGEKVEGTVHGARPSAGRSARSWLDLRA